MAKNQNAESPLEQGRRDTDIRRDTAVRGSMGTPASGWETLKVTPETDVFKEQASGREQESIRGGLEEAGRKLRKTVERIGKRIKP
jgi:hypothetical protein